MLIHRRVDSVVDDVQQENAALLSRNVVPAELHKELREKFDINRDTLKEWGDQLEAKDRENKALLQANEDLRQSLVQQEFQNFTLKGVLQSSNTSDCGNIDEHEQLTEDHATETERLAPIQEEEDLVSGIVGDLENPAPNTDTTLIELPYGVFPIPIGSLADAQLQLMRGFDVMHAERVRTHRAVMAHLQAKEATIEDLKTKLAASEQSKTELRAQLAQPQQSTANTTDALSDHNVEITNLKDQLLRLWIARWVETNRADELQDYGNEQYARADDLEEHKRRLEAELAEIRARVRLMGRVAMVNGYAYYYGGDTVGDGWRSALGI